MTNTRINKYLAEQGYCSRREADGLVKAGQVFVNGKRAALGDKVSDADKVEVLYRKARVAPKKIYLMLHKPVGYVTTTDKRYKDTVMSLVPVKDRLFPVGRLDADSSGLLLMTNDGDLANRLTHPRYEHEDEYDVTLEKPISDDDMRQLAEGVEVEGKVTLPAHLKRLGDARFTIVLKEGRNRQIRRMCDALGYTITILRRTRVRTLRLGTLTPGKHRPLTNEEVRKLH